MTLFAKCSLYLGRDWVEHHNFLVAKPPHILSFFQSIYVPALTPRHVMAHHVIPKWHALGKIPKREADSTFFIDVFELVQGS